jgi:hypothetical protein
MVIIQDRSIPSLSEYRAVKEQVGRGAEQNCPEGVILRKGGFPIPERPGMCGECGAMGSFWVKGYYRRKVVEGNFQEEVLVPRYMCRQCCRVISVLFAFLVPYRHFTVQSIAEGIQKYVISKTTYRSVAGELADTESDMHQPNHRQVWNWVKLFAGRAANVLGIVLQRACVTAGKEKQLTGVSEHACPNWRKAHTLEKAQELNRAARVLVMAEILLDWSGNLVQALQTYFATFVQKPLSILTGRRVRLLTPQSLQHVI